MSREEVAGIEWARWRESLDYQPTHASAWHDGFNAAWDVLLSEIRPLVADLKLASEYDHRAIIGQQVSDRLKHADAVKRLRDLVREGE